MLKRFRACVWLVYVCAWVTRDQPPYDTCLLCMAVITWVIATILLCYIKWWWLCLDDIINYFILYIYYDYIILMDFILLLLFIIHKFSLLVCFILVYNKSYHIPTYCLLSYTHSSIYYINNITLLYIYIYHTIVTSITLIHNTHIISVHIKAYISLSRYIYNYIYMYISTKGNYKI